MTFNLWAGEMDTRPDEFGLCTVDTGYDLAEVACHFLVNFDVYGIVKFHHQGSCIYDTN